MLSTCSCRPVDPGPRSRGLPTCAAFAPSLSADIDRAPEGAGPAAGDRSRRRQMTTEASLSLSTISNPLLRSHRYEMSGRAGARRRGDVLQFAPIFFLLLFLAVNVALIEHLDTSLESKPSGRASIVTTSEVSTSSSGGQSSIDQKPFSNDTVLEHFRRAGVELDEESVKKLPTWETIIQQIGPKPVFLGEETCQRFQDNVPALGRMIGSAGMFSKSPQLCVCANFSAHADAHNRKNLQIAGQIW